jgi:hypothetical protein
MSSTPENCWIQYLSFWEDRKIKHLIPTKNYIKKKIMNLGLFLVLGIFLFFKERMVR